MVYCADATADGEKIILDRGPPRSGTAVLKSTCAIQIILEDRANFM